MSNPGLQQNIAQLAKHLDGTVRGDESVVVKGVNSLQDAQPHEITFITTLAFVQQWADSKAAAAIVSSSVDHDHDFEDGRPVIVVKNVELALITILELFQEPEPVPEVGIHPTAWVHEEATIHGTARIGPHVSVDRGAHIDQDVVLHPGVRIYPEVSIGAGSVLHGNCVIRTRSEIGKKVILHSNVSIGTDGFGYRPSPDGAGLAKMPHLGNVRLEDEVEIGSNSSVDRGKFGSTVLGAGTKIDSLCHIGHNCIIGRFCVIAGQTGIAGSVQLGDFVQVGGGVSISDNLKVGDGVKIGGGSGVMKDLEAGNSYLGYPTDLAVNALRQWAAVRKLPDKIRRLS